MLGEKKETDWLRDELKASWAEIAIVVTLFFAYPAYWSCWAALRGSSHHYGSFLTSKPLLASNILWEGSILALTLGILYFRGWELSDLKIRLDIRGSIEALFLGIASKIGYALILFSIFYATYLAQRYYHLGVHLDGHKSSIPHLGSSNLAMLLTSNIVGVFFEEITWMGYAFRQFAVKRGPLFALGITVLMREICHIYQGWDHVFPLGIVFLLFGLYYWYARNLWPLVFAHILFNSFPVDILKLMIR